MSGQAKALASSSGVTEQKALLIDEGTGEILGRGGAVMYEWEEVDKEGFVKLFLSGLKQASGLSIFEVVYNQGP